MPPNYLIFGAPEQEFRLFWTAVTGDIYFVIPEQAGIQENLS